jgi:hypothetical protein
MAGIENVTQEVRAALDAIHGSAPGSARVEALLSALTALRELRDHIAEWEPELITAARADGASWAALAPALGVASRQAAERRYLRLRPSATGETTGEQRVRAQRDRRAGERAVSSWARENSATLRQLAGQVSALENLPGPGRRHADRLQEALADNDPAALLSPMAKAQDHLGDDNAALAKRLTALTRRADEVRRDTISGRHSHDTS